MLLPDDTPQFAHASDSTPSRVLSKAIVTAHGWRERILAGEICSIKQLAAEARLNARCAGRILRLAALSPSLVDDVVLRIRGRSFASATHASLAAQVERAGGALSIRAIRRRIVTPIQPLQASIHASAAGAAQS